jgi:hypothetical protein
MQYHSLGWTPVEVGAPGRTVGHLRRIWRHRVHRLDPSERLCIYLYESQTRCIQGFAEAEKSQAAGQSHHGEYGPVGYFSSQVKSVRYLTVGIVQRTFSLYNICVIFPQMCLNLAFCNSYSDILYSD